MKIILASHGSLAEGLYSAVLMVAGDEADIEAFGLDKYESPTNIAREVKARIDARDGEHVTILCDIKGGSVYNELLPLCMEEDVSLICGMNMSMAVALALPTPGMTARQMDDGAIAYAKEAIEYFDKDVLKELNRQEGEDDLW